MSERAIIKSEGGEAISVRKAHEMSINGQLEDSRDFICPGCRIALTCTNWGNPKGRRIYFTPTDKHGLHAKTCSEVTPVGNRKALDIVEGETAGICKHIEKINVLKMTKKPPRAYSQKGLSEESDDSGHEPRKGSPKSKKNRITGKETRNCYSIETYVDLFDGNVSISEKSVIIGREKIPLDSLYINIDEISELPVGKTRIFYGKAFMKKVNGKGKVSFEFIRSDVDIIPTSYPHLLSNKCHNHSKSGRILIDLKDAPDQIVTVFFRGECVKKGKYIFQKYSSAFYNDIALRRL